MFKYFKFRAAKYLVVILLVFCISFLSSLAILTWDPTDSVAIFLSYFISFGTAIVINIFLMKRWLHHEQNYLDKISLLSQILTKENGLITIIDENLNILNQLIVNSDFYSRNYSNIEIFLNELGISEDTMLSIKAFVRGKTYAASHSSSKDILYVDNTMVIPGVKLLLHYYTVIVIKLSGDNSLYCITLRKEFRNNEEITLNNLPFGYFELDEAGQIVKVNSQFETSLGYFMREIHQESLFFNSLISPDNTDEHSFETLDLLNKPFQGFIELIPKYAKATKFFLSTFINNDSNTFNKSIKGFIINVNNSNYLENLASLKYNWFEFSWKCFFHHSPYPVCFLDKHGTILKTNPSFITQLTDGELFGKKFYTLFDGNFKSLLQSTIDRTNKDFNLQPSDSFHNIKLKGTTKIVDILLTTIVDLNNEFCGYMVRVSDVTKQKQLEESFSHAQRMQTVGHLVGSVAHDFNNILTAVSGFCDLLLLRHGIGDPSFSNIMQIKQSADRASHLVKRLLAFSRKQTLQLQSINPIDLFSEFTPLIQRLVGSKIKLTLKIDPNIWNIKVDLVQMEQVLLNLVINAQQAIPAEGALTIKADNFVYKDIEQLSAYFIPAEENMPSYDEYVRITVKDTGIGIPKENLLKVFEPFFTTKNDKTGTGTGLGLSTVYGIVRQSNAHIFIKSAPGQGTTFLLLFPKTAVEIVKPELLPVVSKEPSENLDFAGNAVIALVEDEDAIRIFAKKALSNKGFDVLDFSSAKIAYDALKDKIDMIDLVITDVIMPEMSGPSLITKLQALKPNIKVIFMSGYAEEAFTEEYGESRDFNFIAKPFSLKQLLSKVKEVIK